MWLRLCADSSPLLQHRGWIDSSYQRSGNFTVSCEKATRRGLNFIKFHKLRNLGLKLAEHITCVSLSNFCSDKIREQKSRKQKKMFENRRNRTCALGLCIRLQSDALTTRPSFIMELFELPPALHAEEVLVFGSKKILSRNQFRRMISVCLFQPVPSGFGR